TNMSIPSASRAVSAGLLEVSHAEVSALQLPGFNAWKLHFNVIGMPARSHTLARRVERQYAFLAQSRNSSYSHVTPSGG
ncbi:hypothetical protein ABTJ80_20770, partial [Acinetobacter baumannii]